MWVLKFREICYVEKCMNELRGYWVFFNLSLAKVFNLSISTGVLRQIHLRPNLFLNLLC